MLHDPFKNIPKEIYHAVSSRILAPDYYHKTHSRRMARTIEVILDQKPKGKLLELGTSRLIPLALRELAPELEVHVTDFDMDEELIGKMILRIGEESMKAPVYRLDLETQPIPVEDEFFDYVLCTEVIEHMEVDPMFMLSEINRVLKPGGTLFLTTPNIASSRGIHKILRGLDPYFYMQYRHKPSLYRHNYEYTVYSLTSVLIAAGFDGKVWTEDSFEDPILEDVEKIRALGYQLNNIGDNIFTVAKKIGPVAERHPRAIYAD